MHNIHLNLNNYKNHIYEIYLKFQNVCGFNYYVQFNFSVCVCLLIFS